ncbi:hypothetical protein LMG24235_08312 [Paraburkholderia sabiae]|nr:hypothetical protein LMG24235_08312 [Paraburkholderia sabiae]
MSPVFTQRQRKVGKRKPLLYLRCRAGWRFSMPQLSHRAATSALCRKPAVNRARREKPIQFGAHTAVIRPTAKAKKRADRMCPRWMSSFAPRAPDCGLSTECLRRCATAQRPCAVALSWRAPEVQKRLSFAYFSLPLQRKVGAAPHRGNARSTDTNSRMPAKKKVTVQNQPAQRSAPTHRAQSEQENPAPAQTHQRYKPDAQTAREAAA